MDAISYIDAEKLKNIIQRKEEILVIDVRDYDYRGGHIKGSLHYESNQFDKNLPELYEKANKIPIIVFHCAFSQNRGPKAACKYYRYSQEKSNENKQKIYVLSGGFDAWRNAYGENKNLTENFNPDLWEY